jgi:hypothetical protein
MLLYDIRRPVDRDRLPSIRDIAEQVCEVMGDLGGEFDWVHRTEYGDDGKECGEEMYLSGLRCPFGAGDSRDPELCSICKGMLVRMVEGLEGAKVEVERTMARGHRACMFSVTGIRGG